MPDHPSPSAPPLSPCPPWRNGRGCSFHLQLILPLRWDSSCHRQSHCRQEEGDLLPGPAADGGLPPEPESVFLSLSATGLVNDQGNQLISTPSLPLVTFTVNNVFRLLAPQKRGREVRQRSGTWFPLREHPPAPPQQQPSSY